MILRLGKDPIIDNLRHYPTETVEKLRSLLTEGAVACPDPRRKQFYDVQNGSQIFYIHIAPSGKVLLLASWLKPGGEARAVGEVLVPQTCARSG